MLLSNFLLLGKSIHLEHVKSHSYLEMSNWNKDYVEPWFNIVNDKNKSESRYESKPIWYCATQSRLTTQ